MLRLVIDQVELFDERTGEFIYPEPVTLEMEHSLYAMAQWEAKHHKPFWVTRKDETRTNEEMIDYFKFMTITKNVNPEVYCWFGKKEFDAILAYMEDPMTATWFSNQNEKEKQQKQYGPRKAITNELIYATMVELEIPFECEHWHINRLMTLIKVLQERQKPPTKYSRKETMSRYSSLNKQRRALMGSRG